MLCNVVCESSIHESQMCMMNDRLDWTGSTQWWTIIALKHDEQDWNDRVKTTTLLLHNTTQTKQWQHMFTIKQMLKMNHNRNQTACSPIESITSKYSHFHQSACSSHSTTCCLWALVACSVSFFVRRQQWKWCVKENEKHTNDRQQSKMRYLCCSFSWSKADQMKMSQTGSIQGVMIVQSTTELKNEQTNKCVSEEEEDERVNMKQSVKQWTRSKCCVWRGISKLQQKWRHWLKWHNTQTEQCKKQCKNHPHPHNKQQINFLCSNKCNRVSKYHKQTTGNEHVDGLWKAKGKQWWNNDIVDVLAKKMRIKNGTKWKRGGFELWGMSDKGQCLVVMFSW